MHVNRKRRSGERFFMSLFQESQVLAVSTSQHLILVDGQEWMSSKHFVELTGKEHFHILRDIYEEFEIEYSQEQIQNMDLPISADLQQDIIPIYDQLYKTPKIQEILLSKVGALTLSSRYSKKVRLQLARAFLEPKEKPSLPQLIEENKEEAKALLKKEIKQELKQENEERAEKRRQKTMQPTLKQIEVSVGSPEEEETETIWIYGAEKPENRDEKDAALTVLFLASTNYLSAVGKCHEVGAKIPSEPIHYAFDKKLGYTKQIYLLAPLT